ncbi:hypothetical protein HDU80_003285, partial [Chytriomyces hyalinus]
IAKIATCLDQHQVNTNMIDIKQIVLHTHASKNMKVHGLNIYYFDNMSKSMIARNYSKSPATIGHWIE